MVSSRIFHFFVSLRSRHNLDTEAFHILSAFILAGLAEANRDTGKVGTFDPAGFAATLSATAISEMTHIPRETVRRRLHRLCSLGFLEPLSGGRYASVGYWRELDIVDQILRTPGLTETGAR